jgi:DNA-binding FadR family transcriptional regulator
VQARSAVEALVLDIRRLIDSKLLKVGDPLPSERELCERFATSRNTVREAMRMLKAYGVVEVRPKVGATIIDNRMARAFDLFSFNTIEISRKAFTDIQGFRTLIEVNSVDALFDNLDDGHLDRLTAANTAMGQAATREEASEADFAFHVALVGILDNAALIELYRIMKPVIIGIMEKGKSRQDFRTTTFAQHQAVIDALTARDRISYQYALQFHLNLGFNTFGQDD